ncbi:MAG: prepilin peptidase [Verrucomicrobia bacterium]|nr:prepilin peptidase [Verrucomicrobiota bacterium]
MTPYYPLPFHFVTGVFFIFGSMVGSFLNVCIHRMPRGESVVRPRSRCPHCGYSIPWALNVPLVTWLFLRGRCRSCQEPIAARYFLVELLTAMMFAVCWIRFGSVSIGLPVVMALLIAAFIVATFIDLEHYIIPDEITLGGVIAGLFFSFWVPAMHQAETAAEAMKRSFLGAAVGAGVVYAMLRLGKLLFGRQRITLPAASKLVFTETELVLPDQRVPFEDIFYRKSDTVVLRAAKLDLPDRCYRDVEVRLSPERLRIGEEELLPESVPHMEAETTQLVLPREAMGLGDVKFMGAIGAFLGWQATLFSLMFSALFGSLVGVTAIVCGRRDWSSRIPYGPYIAAAAVAWIFLPVRFQGHWNDYLDIVAYVMRQLFWPGSLPGGRG